MRASITGCVCKTEVNSNYVLPLEIIKSKRCSLMASNQLTISRPEVSDQSVCDLWSGR